MEDVVVLLRSRLSFLCTIARVSRGFAKQNRSIQMTSGRDDMARGVVSRRFTYSVGTQIGRRFSFFSDGEHIIKAVGVALTSSLTVFKSLLFLTWQITDLPTPKKICQVKKNTSPRVCYFFNLSNYSFSLIHLHVLFISFLTFSPSFTWEKCQCQVKYVCVSLHAEGKFFPS
jgi:hypothetical protein